jgi:hypothetical protein
VDAVSVEPNKKVLVAFIDRPVQGLGWHGRGVEIEPGAYRVVELEGMEHGIIMLQQPGSEKFLAMVEHQSVDEFREALDTPYAVEWATYYRANPDALASWGEQNGRRP